MDHIKAFGEASCPHCGKVHDSSFNADYGTRGPQPGDPTVCNRCAEVSYFTDDMQMAVINRETIDDWNSQPGLWDSIKQAIAFVKQGPFYDPTLSQNKQAKP